MVPVPVPTFEVTVPVMVPVPATAPYLAPYPDHKKEIFPKKKLIFLPFYIVSYYTRKKFINFNKFSLKCE
jgi:hypothetical protein